MRAPRKDSFRSPFDKEGVFAGPPAAHAHHLPIPAELQSAYLITQTKLSKHQPQMQPQNMQQSAQRCAATSHRHAQLFFQHGGSTQAELSCADKAVNASSHHHTKCESSVPGGGPREGGAVGSQLPCKQVASVSGSPAGTRAASSRCRKWRARGARGARAPQACCCSRPGPPSPPAPSVPPPSPPLPSETPPSLPKQRYVTDAPKHQTHCMPAMIADTDWGSQRMGFTLYYSAVLKRS